MVSTETGRGGERGGRRRGREWGGVPTAVDQLPINAALLLGPAIEISETTATIEIIFSSAAANIGAASAPGKIQERHRLAQQHSSALSFSKDDSYNCSYTDQYNVKMIAFLAN